MSEPPRRDSPPERRGTRPDRRVGPAPLAPSGRPALPPAELDPASGRRVRAGLRRHGLVPSPAAVRALVREHGLRFSGGNAVELYGTGREGLEAMLAAIEAAKLRVHLETYILRTDVTGRRFLDALARRAADGVDVRLLYDAVGSLGLDTGAFGPLLAAGADVVAFNPLRRIYPLWFPRRRDHRKLLIVDGRLAFTGGLNVGDDYWGPAEPEREPERVWRDTHVCVTGPAVRDLEAVFLESWFRADGPALGWIDLLGSEPEPAGEVRCAVLADGPSHRRRRVRDLLIAGLDVASRGVWLASPYFAPGRRVLAALERAGERGAQVRLLLAGARHDHPVLRRAARSLLPRLLSRGVRIHEYAESMMHAKVAWFEGGFAVIGTSNLDRQSLHHSYEVNLVLEGGDIAERVKAMFERDFEGSRRVDTAALDARGPIERAVDWLASLLLWIV